MLGFGIFGILVIVAGIFWVVWVLDVRIFLVCPWRQWLANFDWPGMNIIDKSRVEGMR